MFRCLRRRRLVFVLSWRFPPLEVVLVVSSSLPLTSTSSSLPGEEGFGRGVAVSDAAFVGVGLLVGSGLLLGNGAPSWLSALSVRLSAFGFQLLALGSQRSALGFPISFRLSALSLGFRFSFRLSAFALGFRFISRLSAFALGFRFVSRLSAFALGIRFSFQLSAFALGFREFGSWLLALGSRLSAFGFGSWLLALGSQLLAFGFGYRLLALGSWLLALGFWLSDSALGSFGFRIFVLSPFGSFGFWLCFPLFGWVPFVFRIFDSHCSVGFLSSFVKSLLTG